MTWTYHENEEQRDYWCDGCGIKKRDSYFYKRPISPPTYRLCLSCAEELASAVISQFAQINFLPAEPCLKCGGQGQLYKDIEGADGYAKEEAEHCPICHGSGGKPTNHIYSDCLHRMPIARRCKLGHFCLIPCEEYEADVENPTCPTCGGTGQVPKWPNVAWVAPSGTFEPAMIPCPACTGEVSE